MTVQQIADRLVELCRAGQFDQCYHELFATDADAYEMPGFPLNNHTKGVEALLAKSKAFADKTEAFYGFSVSDPIVEGDTFAVGMMIDMTEKGKDRTKSHEICAYVVKDGKIASEHFIYAM
ncbi:MAG: SnoaL-like domain-containing protein [Lewinella sp.]